MQTTMLSRDGDIATFTVALTAAEIQEKFGGDTPTAEVLERWVRARCREAMDLLGLEPAELPTVEFDAICPGESLGVTVTVACMPTVELKQYKGVKVSVPEGTSRPAGQELTDAVLDEVVRLNRVEVPQNMLDDEISMRVSDLTHKLCYRAMADGSSLTFLQKDVEDRMDSIRAAAERQLKVELLLKAVIRAEGLTVTPEELETAAKQIAAEQKITLAEVKDFLGEDLKLLEQDVLIQKAEELLVSTAQVGA
jgi:FKBP-type peptidyl-prolyl cis-trans isomerase (trigger factor)